MKLKKKMVLAVAVVLVFTMSLAACGGSGSNSGSGGDAPSTAAESGGSGGGDKPTSTDVLYGENTFEYVDDQYDKTDWIKLDLAYADFLPSTEVGNALNGYILHGLQSELGDDYINMRFYSNSTLLNQENMVDGLRAGTADIGMVCISFFPNEFPVSNMWIQPGMGVQSSSGGSGAFASWLIDNQDKYPEYDDFVALHGSNNGPVSFETTFKIESLSDLKGKQITTAPILSSVIQALAANPINLPTSEAYEAFRSGLVEGAYESLGGTMVMGYTDYASNALVVALNSEVYAYCMNKSSFEKMPPSQQEAFLAGWHKGWWEGQLPHYEELMILSAPPIVENAPKLKSLTIAEPGSPIDVEIREKTASALEAYKETLNGLGFDADSIQTEILGYEEDWNEWWGFDREMEFYRANLDGTYEEWRANYHIPDNMPEH